MPGTELLAQVEAIARAAGELILQVYGTDFAVQGKADASPVTAADERAEACIVPALRALRPDWPVVAEEAASRGELPVLAQRFWLVDPLDGTREFVSRNGEFTVNIALIDGGRPVLGVVHIPVQDRLFAGIVGQGAWVEEKGAGGQGMQRRAIGCSSASAAGLRVASSRSHGDEAATTGWLRGRAVAARVTAGSSLKFGLIAAGEADVYPRFGRTMEWDTAAGHAVLAAAGGCVTDLAGAPLRYGKPGFENPHFVAWGSPSAGF
jgi:3'(2'), 5'-bisphosphate nucleotidase